MPETQQPEDWRKEPRAITVRTRAEAEARACAEREAYAGRLLQLTRSAVHFGDGDLFVEGRDVLLTVRVHPGTTRPQHTQDWQADWSYGWLDPRWGVDVVGPPGRKWRTNAWIFSRPYYVDENVSPLEELAQASWAPDFRELRC
jgi:hypothetical protein